MEQRIKTSLRNPADQKPLPYIRDTMANANSSPRRLGTSADGVFVIDFGNEKVHRQKPQTFTLWCDQAYRVEIAFTDDHTQRQLLRERAQPHVPIQFQYRTSIIAVYITPHQFPATLEYQPIYFEGEDGFIFASENMQVVVDRGTAENASMDFSMEGPAATVDVMFNAFASDDRATLFTGSPPFALVATATEVNVPRQPSHWRLDFVSGPSPSPGVPAVASYRVNSGQNFDLVEIEEEDWVEQMKNTVCRFHILSGPTAGTYRFKLHFW